MTHSMISRIEARLDALSRAETQVAHWIVANPRRCIDMSIGELAKAAQVSDPTVVRFCRSMGLTGYRELKTKLVATMHHPDNYLHHVVKDSDSSLDAFNKVVDNSIRALVDLRDHTGTMPVADAVETMSTARQILFVGVGASGHVASDAQHKFFRLGLPCSTALDAQTILQCAAIAEPNDVFVAISSTGRWPDLVKSMHIARDRGASVIALTDPHSPLADAATYLFTCHPAEDTDLFTPMSSRLNHLALLDALQVALALTLGQFASTKLQLSKAALLEHRLQQV